MVLAACLCDLLSVRAESPIPVPPKLQAAILGRMLAYDRAFKTRVGSTVGIGVVSRAGDKTSAEDEAEMRKAFKAMDPPTIQGLPVAVSGHSYKDAAAFAEWIETDKVNVLYVTSGLAAQLEAIGLVCARKKIVSVTGTRAFVEKTIAIGVVVKGDTPKIVVNLKTADLVGMSLDPKLLQLAEVIR
jgi:YfiR/HmsC-like